jgi:hypothetical protein
MLFVNQIRVLPRFIKINYPKSLAGTGTLLPFVMDLLAADVYYEAVLFKQALWGFEILF